MNESHKKQISVLTEAWKDNRNERMPAWLFQQNYKKEIRYPDFLSAIGKADLKDAIKTLILVD